MHSSPKDLWRFAEKVQLAREADLAERPRRGTSGLELEWDLLDSGFRPLQTVGAGPEERPFVDAFRSNHLAPWLAERSQLEVFQWMIEFATQPYYFPWGAVYESRILEAALINALARAGRAYGQRLYASTGNLLHAVDVGAHSIPQGWNLAKRRYLEHCVELFGRTLATTGVHANLSLPEAMLAWDFVHLPLDERGNGHLDAYKNRVYIEGTRRMRAFASLFVATSASTPMRPEPAEGSSRVVLTDFDSVRNLTFPCPESIDPPDLYRSHEDYLRISYDLVRQGVRFGNNNWNPVRARSFAEPVERLIEVSSDQLHGLYQQGIYAAGQAPSVEEMARQVVVQNLLARIDLPMARVEVRTDEAGHPLDVEIANLALKELLVLRIYADPAYGAAFRYAADDIARARRGERRAAEAGLRAEVEDPFSGKPIAMRRFLSRTLEDVAPLAEALGWKALLEPLEEMAGGGPNTAERLRARLRAALGGSDLVPPDLLIDLAKEREAEVSRDVETVRSSLGSLGEDAAKLQVLLAAARDEARRDPGVPVRFRSRPSDSSAAAPADKTAEILDLAKALIRIRSVSGASPERQRIEEIRRASTLVYDYLTEAGLGVRIFEDGDYPAIFATLASGARPPVLLSAHLDVVDPDPDEGQFEPRLEGDYLHGRGAADMKTVLATYLVWLKDLKRRAAPPPGVGLLVVSNEEIGEAEPMGTPHVLEALRRESAYEPRLLIAGERTGERGDELWGEVCVENRGLVRLELSLLGTRGHTGTRLAGEELSARLFRARDGLKALFEEVLRVEAPDEWRTQVRFPFILVGEAGVYNVAAGRGVLGIEIRPIPGDEIDGLLARARAYCQEAGLALRVVAAEPGISCPSDNPYLGRLIDSVRELSGQEPMLGRKLPATSARFAPGGAGIVWGQSGIGPHGPDEKHYVPSILPYYRALDRFGEKCLADMQGV